MTYSSGNWRFLTYLYNTFIAVTTIGFGDQVVLDDFDEYLEERLEKSNWFVARILQFTFMTNIILILVLFSTFFEQLKQTNVKRVSKRVSHVVNIMNFAFLKSRGPINPIYPPFPGAVEIPRGDDTLGGLIFPMRRTSREFGLKHLGPRNSRDRG